MVKFNGTVSKWLGVRGGVYQHSVLSPLLYTMEALPRNYRGSLPMELNKCI
jgi:hypothetical protein